MKQENVEGHKTRNRRRPQVFEELSGSPALASKIYLPGNLLNLLVLMNPSEAKGMDYQTWMSAVQKNK
jgi:hypothetical protein